MFLLIASLVGCAAQQAFRDGKSLISQNNFDEGIAKLKIASDSEPENQEYRRTYLQSKERSIYLLSDELDRLIQQEKFEEARKIVRRVAAIEPNHQIARIGMSKVEASERIAEVINDSAIAIEKKDLSLAKRLLADALAKDSNNLRAKQLLASIDQGTLAHNENRLANHFRKSISIEFRDAPLRQVLDVISRSSGLNFIFDKEVRTDQRTSIFLKNSTIESAIQFVLVTNQLSQQVLDGNSILIFPNSKQKDYQELIVKSFYLVNADAKRVENSLKSIVKAKDLVVDEKLNMIIMRDSPDAIQMAEKIVAMLDIAESEVMLEVEILEVKRSRLLDMGIQWPTTLGLTPLASAQGATLTFRDLANNVTASTLGASLGPATAKLRKEDGDANLLANPRIRAKNREKANILIGERVPNITSTATSTGFVSESINYIEVGLKLEVEPTVYLDNDVGIRVALEVSSITNQQKTQSGSLAYQIGTRNASTTLRLKNGETQVLAGLINDEERRSSNKIPALGDLPILGRLFGSNVNESQKTEIILSITPHLIRNIQVPDAASTSFSSGTEGSIRLRSTSSGESFGSREQNVSGSIPGAIGRPTTQDLTKKFGSEASLDQTSPRSSVPGGGGIVNNVGGAPHIQWQGPKQVKLGDTFSLQMVAQSDQAVTAMPMKLSFDPQYLQVVSVNEGIFMKQGGAQTNFVKQVDPKGFITITNSRTLGGATSPGGYATIVLRAVSTVESTPIQVLSIEPVGMSGRPLGAPQVQPLVLSISQ